MIKVYLDVCCLNRPFDDQSQMRVHLESEAVLYIQEKIREGKLNILWSYVIDVEVYNNPFEDRRNSILDWKNKAISDVAENDDIIKLADTFSKIGIDNLDALHLGCAIYSNSDFFITTDDDIIKLYSYHGNMQVVNPIDFINVFENMEKKQ